MNDQEARRLLRLIQWGMQMLESARSARVASGLDRPEAKQECFLAVLQSPNPKRFHPTFVVQKTKWRLMRIAEKRKRELARLAKFPKPPEAWLPEEEPEVSVEEFMFVLRKLPERDWKILLAVKGEGKYLHEVAKEFKITRERVRQIANKAVGKFERKWATYQIEKEIRND